MFSFHAKKKKFVCENTFTGLLRLQLWHIETVWVSAAYNIQDGSRIPGKNVQPPGSHNMPWIFSLRGESNLINFFILKLLKFNVTLTSGIYTLEENKPEEDVHGSFTLCGEDNCGWAISWVIQWFKSAWFSQ